jgi:hypothetical protein
VLVTAASPFLLMAVGLTNTERLTDRVYVVVAQWLAK